MENPLLEFFERNKRERRGFAVLVVLCLVFTGIYLYLRLTPSPFEESSRLRADSVLATYRDTLLSPPERFGDYRRNSSSAPDFTDFQEEEPKERVLPTPFAFDVNGADIATFVRLGFTEKQAEAIIRFRSASKGFRDTAHFWRSRVISPEMKMRLWSYASVATKIEPEQTDSRKQSSDTTGRKERVRWWPAHPLELNEADSLSFDSLPGIGPWFARQMHEYRDALGGYTDVNQLLEIKYFRPGMIDTLLPHIVLENKEVEKLNVNKLNTDKLARHPYINFATANAIVRHRIQKGKYQSVNDLVHLGFIPDTVMVRLRPYLTVNE